MQTIFTADMTLIDDPDEGLRVECIEPHLALVSRALETAGFDLGIPVIAVQGTSKLPSVMELPVANGTFDDMKLAICKSLTNAKVSVTEENFSALGEKRVRFNLNNVSLYGN